MIKSKLIKSKHLRNKATEMDMRMNLSNLATFINRVFKLILMVLIVCASVFI